MDRDDLPDLLTFCVVAEERSFRRAATRMAVSASAISHSLRRLEAKLGTALLNRTTRSVSASEAGNLLLRRLRPAFDAIDEGLVELAGRRAQISGHVRIDVHPTAAELVIVPKLAALRRAYPEVTVELALNEGIVDIVANGFDAGVRNGERLEKDMIAVRISDKYRTAVVAAPAYLVGRSSPDSPADLERHACIVYRFVTSRALHRWRFERDDREFEVSVEPAVITDDTRTMVRSAVCGVGLAYVLREMVADELASGALVEVLAEWSVRMAPSYLYYPGRRHLSPAMRAVVEHLRVA